VERGQNDTDLDVGVAVGSTLFELMPDELRRVGGDYGSIHLEGTTPAARRALDAIAEAVGRLGCRARINLSVDVDDAPPAIVEDWHAGFARTPERGVGDTPGGSGSAESGVANGTSERDFESGDRQ